MDEPTTIKSALQEARQELYGFTDLPEIDAEWLLLHILRQDESSWLYSHPELELGDEQVALFNRLLQERKNGRPIGQLISSAEFYGRTFFVNDHVLIPRPETEHLVDAALSYIQKNKPSVVADVGTGSGCIIISLALELTRYFKTQRSKFKYVATDISEKALEVAIINAERHGVADQIEFLQGDMLEPLTERQIDFIVSNPPYVPAGELERAGTSVNTRGLLYEPRLALDGGPDGQDYISIIKKAGVPYVIETTGGVVKTTTMDTQGFLATQLQ